MSPIYWVQSFPGLSFSFRCFVDNSILSPGPMLDFLHTLSAHCLSASAYFVSHSWISVYNLCISLTDNLLWQAFALVIPQYLLANVIYDCVLSLVGILPICNCGMALINILTRGNLPTHSPCYACIHNTCSIVRLVTLAIPSI